ncbi:MAG TPA: tetratricopeptide repeat protein, partial [Pirellulaceae bacterium]|nr:tetratricopeptide repeat protein [Pirellulaceae bacterium]
MPIRRRSIFIATTVLAGAVVAWALAQSATRRSDLAAETQYEAAVAALREQRFSEAYERGLEAASNRRYHREGLLIAGEALAKLGRPVEALAVLSEVPADGSRFAVASLLARGELFIGPLRRLAAAEATYREALKLAPENIVAHERLAYVLGLQGRAWEAAPHRIAVLRSGRASPIHLILLALGDSADENPETVKAFYQSDPNDVAALCGLGRMELNREHPAEARRWVAAAIDRDPRLWQAQAGLGRALWELGERDVVEKWRRELPDGADEHPAVWHVRGVVAEGSGRTDEAVDCYRRAALLDPNHLTSLHALSRLAAATRGGSHRYDRASEIGERDKADVRGNADELGVVGSIGDVNKILGSRAKQLEELAIAARAYQIGGTLESPRRAAQVAAQLGLCWEAWGWWELQKSQRELTADEQREQAAQLTAARQDGAARCVHATAKPLLAALEARNFPALRNSLASSRESGSRVVDRSAAAATSVKAPVGDAATRDESSSHGHGIRWREMARDVGVDF